MRVSDRAALVLTATLALAACHDRRPAEGPMEYSGRKVDEAGHATKEGAEKAGHDTKCGAKNAKDDAQHQPRQAPCN